MIYMLTAMTVFNRKKKLLKAIGSTLSTQPYSYGPLRT